MSQERSVRDVSGLYTLFSGGGGGIRTPETLSSLTVFKTAGFNRSPTPPLMILTHLFEDTDFGVAQSLYSPSRDVPQTAILRLRKARVVLTFE
jgi:hypothetical protein